MMRRDQFCALAGETIDAFKSKARRGQVPFLVPEGRYARAVYSPWRAVIFLAFKRALEASQAPEEAVQLFGRFEEDLRRRARAPLQGDGFGSDFYVGWMRVADANSVRPQYVARQGTLKQVAESVTNWQMHEDVGIASRGTPTSLMLVNLSAVIRDVERRARDLGIDLNAEYVAEARGAGELIEDVEDS